MLQRRKPICALGCARDMAGQAETGKTRKTRGDLAGRTFRGQRDDGRQLETSETHVVRRSITQRRIGGWDGSSRSHERRQQASQSLALVLRLSSMVDGWPVERAVERQGAKFQVNQRTHYAPATH